MNASARLAEPSSASADLDDVTDPPDAAVLRLLAEFFSAMDDTPPPGVAEQTIARCEARNPTTQPPSN